MGKETVKWKGKGVSDMSEWNYGRWALNLRSLRADLLQVLLWSERSGTATATSSNSWLNSWLLTRPSAMLFGRLPGPSATLPITVHARNPTFPKFLLLFTAWNYAPCLSCMHVARLLGGLN